jgi:hypothetical protein
MRENATSRSCEEFPTQEFCRSLALGARQQGEGLGSALVVLRNAVGTLRHDDLRESFKRNPPPPNKYPAAFAAADG